MATFKEIVIPPRLERRPKDSRGYPIPAGVVIDLDGRPDFKVTDLYRWMNLVKMRACGLCGEPLGRHLAFIGGPLSHKSRMFTDLPMHRDCAEYALQVCPYLAAPRFKYAEKVAELAGYTLNQSDLVEPERPEKFFLSIAKSYRVVKAPSGEYLLNAGEWEQTEWWIHGVKQ